MADEKVRKINPRLENFVKGLALCLFSVIIILNVGKIGRTLAFLPLYLFGATYYFVFGYFFLLGLYRMIFGKKLKLKIQYTIGIIILFIALFVFVSIYGVDLSKPFKAYNEQLATYYKPVIINAFDQNTMWQGGLIGTVIAKAAHNKTAVVFVGSALIALATVVMLLPWVVKLIKNRDPKAPKTKKEKKAKVKKQKHIVVKEEPAKPIDNPVIAREPMEVKPGFENDRSPFINENSGFSKPTVSLDESYGVSYNHNDYNEFTPLVFSRTKKIEPVQAKPLVMEEAPIKEEQVSIMEEVEEPVENLIESRPEVVIPEEDNHQAEINNELARTQPEFITPIEKEEPRIAPAPVVETPKKKVRVNWVPPSSELLEVYETEEAREKNEAVAEARVDAINKILADFKIGARCIGYKIGPSITRFNIEYDPNVSVKSVERLVGDISVRLNGVSVRFTPIVFGESYSGLEIPNATITTVSFKEVFDSLPAVKKHPLSVAFGKDISGNVIAADFDEFPHLLVAGTTGSGKSIYIHSIISTLIMRVSPDDLKIVLVDPKKVEMTKYRDMPHLLCPIITEAEKTKVMLCKLVDEMNARYEMFGENGEVSNIKQYNEWAKDHGVDPLPFIIVVLDEYADLIDTCKEISQPVVSIAQKARAAGIHLLISTQRPSTNVITGVIKGNLPTHVALMTSNYTDSMTIIGEGGAETLLGKGDMLVQSPLVSRVGVTRLQGCYVQNKEISHIVGYLKEHYETNYDEKFLDLIDHSKETANQMVASGEIMKEADEAEEMRYQSIKEWVLTQKFVSMSKIQRECSVGFNRAGRFFKRLQQEGVVATEIDGTSKGCKVLGAGYDDDDNYVSSDELIS